MGKEIPVFSSTQPLEGQTPESAELCKGILPTRRESTNTIVAGFPEVKKFKFPLSPRWIRKPWMIGIGPRLPLATIENRKPIQLFCVRDRGSYQDVYESEKIMFLQRLSVYDDEESQIAREFIDRARFIATTQMVKNDITEEGYDFNGWILEFFQENCNGIVQIDGQGFFSPRGELVVDMEESEESGKDGSPVLQKEGPSS